MTTDTTPHRPRADDIWHFEDYEVGYGGETYGRMVTDADILQFAALSGDYHPVHFDAEYAATRTAFGRRVAHGLIGVSITTGLLARDAPEILGTRYAGLAFPGIEWRFVRPILPGDTIRVRYRVESKRLTSRRDRGIVNHAVEVVNQDGEVVQTGVITQMVAAREG